MQESVLKTPSILSSKQFERPAYVQKTPEIRFNKPYHAC